MNLQEFNTLPTVKPSELARPDLDWVLNPQPKNYEVRATALVYDTGKRQQVQQTLKHGQFDTIEEAQTRIELIKEQVATRREGFGLSPDDGINYTVANLRGQS